MSGSASLAQCVMRKRCFHAMLLGKPSWPAPRDSGFGSFSQCFKLGSTYRSCVLVPSTYCRASLANETHASASPSHPRIRKDRSRSPASPVMYFRESCCTATTVGHHQSVSWMCVGRISKLMADSLFPSPQRQIRLLSKGRGEVLPAHSLTMASPQIQKLKREPHML